MSIYQISKDEWRELKQDIKEIKKALEPLKIKIYCLSAVVAVIVSFICAHIADRVK